MTERLNIMEIERFALHDGPGIRTTVFLKGCPLRCPWCSNPESQTLKRMLLYSLNKCLACGKCYRACPHNAIEWQNDKPVFLRERCMGCESCRMVCPGEAIRFSGKMVSVKTVIDEVVKDRDYYAASGGGMTVSGGEPFVQWRGLTALLEAAKTEGIHTAVETTGQTARENILAAMELVDLFLFDVKHIDREKLRNVNLADWDLIHGNLQTVINGGADVVARIPVIPGFNLDDLGEIIETVAKDGVEEVNLLAYHTLGAGKYTQLGMAYPWDGFTALDKSELQPSADFARGLGLKVEVL